MVVAREQVRGDLEDEGVQYPSDPQQLATLVRGMLADCHAREQQKAQQEAQIAKWREGPRAGVAAGFRNPFGEIPAIVCADLPTVQLMWGLQNDFNERQALDAKTSGRASLVRGRIDPPDYAAYGCTSVPSGTPVQLADKMMGYVTSQTVGGKFAVNANVTVMSGTLPSGAKFSGVTMSSMYRLND